MSVYVVQYPSVGPIKQVCPSGPIFWLEARCNKQRLQRNEVNDIFGAIGVRDEPDKEKCL